jgi:hypothetical protein
MEGSMNDNPTPENQSSATGSEPGLNEEFGTLGKNLLNLLRVAWERPERQKLQMEIEGGLNEMAETFRKEAKNFSDSQVGQRIKSDLDDLGERVRSGEVETKVRSELLGALKVINTELEKAANNLSSTAAGKSDSAPGGGEPPAAPPSDGPAAA